jgi:hypothetical protein
MNIFVLLLLWLVPAAPLYKCKNNNLKINDSTVSKGFLATEKISKLAKGTKGKRKKGQSTPNVGKERQGGSSSAKGKGKGNDNGNQETASAKGKGKGGSSSAVGGGKVFGLGLNEILIYGGLAFVVWKFVLKK